jgi:hypothetical protein
VVQVAVVTLEHLVVIIQDLQEQTIGVVAVVADLQMEVQVVQVVMAVQVSSS